MAKMRHFEIITDKRHVQIKCTCILQEVLYKNEKKWKIIQYNTIQYNTIQYNTIRYNTVIFVTDHLELRTYATGDKNYDFCPENLVSFTLEKHQHSVTAKSTFSFGSF